MVSREDEAKIHKEEMLIWKMQWWQVLPGLFNAILKESLPFYLYLNDDFRISPSYYRLFVSRHSSLHFHCSFQECPRIGFLIIFEFPHQKEIEIDGPGRMEIS